MRMLWRHRGQSKIKDKNVIIRDISGLANLPFLITPLLSYQGSKLENSSQSSQPSFQCYSPNLYGIVVFEWLRLSNVTKMDMLVFCAEHLICFKHIYKISNEKLGSTAASIML